MTELTEIEKAVARQNYAIWKRLNELQQPSKRLPVHQLAESAKKQVPFKQIAHAHYANLDLSPERTMFEKTRDIVVKSRADILKMMKKLQYK